MGLLMKEATEILLNMSILNRDSFTLRWAWNTANTNMLTKQQAGPSTVRTSLCPATPTTLDQL